MKPVAKMHENLTTRVCGRI